MLGYPVVLKRDTNGQLMVRFPDIPEALSAGDDEADALVMGREALITALDFYFDDRRLVPQPSHPKRGQKLVFLPARIAAKVLLHNAMVEQGVRKAELARRIGVAPPNIERLLNPRYASKIEQVETALAALGKRLVVETV
jgi:antitoxin HicB